MQITYIFYLSYSLKEIKHLLAPQQEYTNACVDHFVNRMNIPTEHIKADSEY